MNYAEYAPQLSLDLGPPNALALKPHVPHLVLRGFHQGQWVVEIPGHPPLFRPTEARASALYEWVTARWRASGHFVVVYGDLYDLRKGAGPGKRVRHGYRELFYHILDGHQLRSTLRFLEGNPLREHYYFVTEWAEVVCRTCVLDNLREAIGAIRGWHTPAEMKVVGCELHKHASAEPPCCYYCYDEIPLMEGEL